MWLGQRCRDGVRMIMQYSEGLDQTCLVHVGDRHRGRIGKCRGQAHEPDKAKT